MISEIDQEQAILELKKQGVPIADIARRLGLTRQAVYRRIEAANKPKAPKHKSVILKKAEEGTLVPAPAIEAVQAVEAANRTEMLWYDKLEQSMEQFERLIESEDISDSVRVAAISGKANLAAQVLKAWAQMQAHAVKRDPTLIPEIQILIARVLDALEPFEEAKEAVRKVLR